MFIKIVFKKFGLKENKYVMGLMYSIIYMIFFYGVLSLSQLYLKNYNFKKNMINTLIIGVVMYLVYLIKWEIINSKIFKTS